MEIVREHLFQRGLEPKEAMGIGRDRYMRDQIRQFIKTNFDFDYRSIYPENGAPRFWKILEICAGTNQLEYVKFLIEKVGVPPDGFESKPLRGAIKFAHYDVIKYLLSKGAKVTKFHIKSAHKSCKGEIIHLLKQTRYEQQKEKYPKVTEWKHKFSKDI